MTAGGNIQAQELKKAAQDQMAKALAGPLVTCQAVNLNHSPGSRSTWQTERSIHISSMLGLAPLGSEGRSQTSMENYSEPSPPRPLPPSWGSLGTQIKMIRFQFGLK